MKSKTLNRILMLCGFFIFATGLSVSAQQEKKNNVFEFSIAGLKTQEDVAKLDSAFMKRKGIVSSKTDLVTKKTKVTTVYFIEYVMLQRVVVAAGFEAPDKNVIAKPEEEQH